MQPLGWEILGTGAGAGAEMGSGVLEENILGKFLLPNKLN